MNYVLDTIKEIKEFLKKQSPTQVFIRDNPMPEKKEVLFQDHKVCLAYFSDWNYYKVEGLTSIEEEEFEEILKPLGFDVII